MRSFMNIFAAMRCVSLYFASVFVEEDACYIAFDCLSSTQLETRAGIFAIAPFFAPSEFEESRRKRGTRSWEQGENAAAFPCERFGGIEVSFLIPLLSPILRHMQAGSLCASTIAQAVRQIDGRRERRFGERGSGRAADGPSS